MSKSRDMAAARAEKAKKAQARAKTIVGRVEEILASDRVDPELKRKLAYCRDEIAKGRNEGLVNRRAELIREAERRLQNP